MPARQRRFDLPERLDDPHADLEQLLKALGADEVQALAGNLPAREVAVLQRLVATRHREGWRAHPAAWRQHLDPTFERWPYVDLLSESFAGAVNGTDNPHQQWNLPSQYGKTTIGLTGIGWALDIDPRKRWLYVTASDDKAKEEAGNLRDFVLEHSADLSFDLRPDRRSRGMWRTDQGGGLYAFGLDATIVGYPADGELLDDLLRGYVQALSAAERTRVWNIITSVLRKRLQSESCPYIWTGTRWHEDDHFARQREQSKADTRAYRFKVIRLAAIAEPPQPDDPDPVMRQPDALGRAVGVVLEPRRFTATEVLARQADSSISEWMASEQQRPVPPAGDLIKREWWQWDSNRPTRFDVAATSWDLKGGDNDRGDYTVGQVWGRTGQHFWFLGQLRGQWPKALAAIAMALLQVRHPGIKRHFVEKAGYAIDLKKELETARPGYELDPDLAGQVGVTLDELAAVERQLRRGISGIELVPAVGSKILRAENQTPKLVAKVIHLPDAGQPGHAEAKALVDEAASFPRGSHDDQVDAWSQAVAKLSTARSKVTRTTAHLPTR